MMDKLIQEFIPQLEEALTIGEKFQPHDHPYEIQKIYVAGMGGSGIGANFVKELIKSECSVSFSIGKSYNIPAFVDKNTLAIVSSYSGNTEETLNSFNELLKTGAQIVVISSGGKLIEKAKEKNIDFIQLPAGSPSPRACLGYSLVQQLFVLNKLGLINNHVIQNINDAIQLLKEEQAQIKLIAENIALRIWNKIPIIYSTDRIESVAIRCRQQLNENANMLCWHHVIPEMNHNELVGWSSSDFPSAVLFLRNDDDYERNQIRIEIIKNIIREKTDTLIEVFSKGESLVEKMLYLVHLVDWISWYAAQKRGEDAIEIKAIDYLKSELSKF